MFTDSHTHLYLEDFNNDLNIVIDNAKQQKVNRFLLPNIDINTLPNVIDLHKRNPKLFYPMIGLHPCSVTGQFYDELKKIHEYITQYPFIGVGEIGIDLYWDQTYIAEQKEAFKIQIGWSKTHDLPIIIHSRNSFNEIYDILSTEKSENTKGVFHCFSGNYEEAMKIIEMGLYLGIGGIITFKNSKLFEVIKKIDLKHIILETDAPYLAPHPMRGKRNEPKFLPIIAEKIAEIKQITIQEVAERTNENIEKLFSIKVA
ncbi:MAG: hydrolase TatD [Flavobacteriales bacterium]|nr:hydrolase TatD [Flavobacteriales bacterium]|tara:strand:- start:10205 stop:10978 length:774 start_codon:yes stop_codon:yes gene_type:complete